VRGQGEGSIYRRADGYWVGQVEAGHYPNGRRRRARIVRRRRAEVVEHLDELRRNAAQGVVGDRTVTVEGFLAWWLDEVVAGEVSAQTAREYRKRLARVTPHIGRVRLGRLKPTHIQGLVNELARQYPRTPATRASTLRTLRRALRWAVGAQLIARNPAEAVDGPRQPAVRVDDTLTAEDAKAVLSAAEGDAELGALWWLALSYGLRLGELLDLRWSDVDLDAGDLAVRRSKTAAGVRTLPLTADAMAVLRRHRARPGAVASIEGYVFPSSTGRQRAQQPIRDAWNELLRAAGVAHMCRNCSTNDAACTATVRRFHASRHTAATLLLEAGVPLEVVSAVLGHSSIGIMANVYAKVRADLKRQGLSRLSAT
jgi:integrase